jgi:hypothetical protein
MQRAPRKEGVVDPPITAPQATEVSGMPLARRSMRHPMRHGLRHPLRRAIDRVDLVGLVDLFLPTYKNCQIYLRLSSHKTKLVQ